ncbi:MAG TPA: choice-of-anchor D domain-containing protein [Candidatus Limnocylindrales bacterium]|nr:choice-of-anchor D domain-containing protein [Candidatus Limnocylindrales bacterium]
MVLILMILCCASQPVHAQAAGSQSLLIVGSIGPNVPTGTSATFAMTVNTLTKTVTYCECILNGQLIDNPTAIMQGLVNAFNGDTTSPVTASLTRAGITLTPKVSGTFLTISSVDNGAGLGGLSGIGFLGIPIVPIQDKSSFTVVGSINANTCNGCSSTFSVNVNNFVKSATYCECVLNGKIIDNPTAVMQALVTAFNADGASPVTAAVTNGMVTLTAKVAGTVLTVTTSDDGAQPGGLGGINFLALPIVPAQDTAELSIIGSIGPNLPNGSPGTFTITVNGFSKSATYCECLLNGQVIDNPRALEQALVDALNADATSPVTASLGSNGVELTAKTLGTVVTVTANDNNAGVGGLSGIGFLGVNGSLPSGSGPIPGFVNPKYIVVGVTYAPPGPQSRVDYTNSVMLGTSTSIQNSFKRNITASVKISKSIAIPGLETTNGKVVDTVSVSNSFTNGSTDGKSVTVNKTTTQSQTTPGPSDAFIGLDHDFDLVWVWLNPVVSLGVNDPNNPSTVTWNGVGFDPADAPDLEVIPIPVGVLNGDLPLQADLAARLARAWAAGQAFPAGTGPGLTGPGTGTDFDAIVRFDPFWDCTPHPANCPTTIDAVRFTKSDSSNLIYQQADPGQQPGPNGFGLNYTNTSVVSHGDSTEVSHTISIERAFSGGAFIGGLDLTLNDTTSFTQGTDTKTDLTTTQSGNVTATIVGPTCTVPAGENFCQPQYTGPVNFLVYMDNKFGSFMFFPTTDPRFVLAATPANAAIPVGGTATYTITSTAIDGFTGNVALTLIGLPTGQGMTATFSPATIPAAGGTSTLTVTTTSATPAASTNLAITGTSGTLVEHVPVVLQVQDFTVQVTPGSQTVAAGASTSFQVTITAVDGTNLTGAALSVTGLPANASASFSPPTANGAGGVNSTMTITTTASVIGGNYPLTVCGNVIGLSHCAVPVTLTVTAPDFSISATPTSQTVLPGGATTYTINTSALNGFAGNITLTLTGLPSNATATFSPSVLAAGSSSTLTVTTSTTTPGGSFQLSATGTAGAIVHSTPIILVVNAAQDFSISITPQSAGISVGGSATYTVSISGINGFTGNVTLSASGLPATITPSFSVNPIAAGGSSTLTLSTSTSTVPGNYSFTVTGVNGTLQHSVPATLTVNAPPDFSVSITPSSQTVVQGSCVSYTITNTALNGFAGVASITITGLPTGATATASPTTITGSGSSTITICTSSTTPAGSYSLTVTEVSGSISHSQPFTLVVNVPAGFALNSNTSSQTVMAGSSTNYTVSTTVVGGFSGNVGLTITGLPAGSTASFAPSTIAGAGSSVLTVNTTGSVTPGSYTLNLSGTSGTLQSNTNVTLVAVMPQTAVLSPTSVSFASQMVGTRSTAQTITLTNTGGAALSISGINVTGDFSQTTTCGTSLAAGASCSIQVTFAPTATGSRTGTISVTDNAAGSPHSASLSGTGVAPAVTLSTASLTFGSTTVGTSSAAQSVTLTNTGSAALSISGISATGDFSQTNTCGTSVAVNASCSISVVFSPTLSGTRTGSLTISDNASGGSQSVALTGTAVNPPPPPPPGGGGCTGRLCQNQ